MAKSTGKAHFFSSPDDSQENLISLKSFALPFYFDQKGEFPLLVCG